MISDNCKLNKQRSHLCCYSWLLSMLKLKVLFKRNLLLILLFLIFLSVLITYNLAINSTVEQVMEHTWEVFQQECFEMSIVGQTNGISFGPYTVQVDLDVGRITWVDSESNQLVCCFNLNGTKQCLFNATIELSEDHPLLMNFNQQWALFNVPITAKSEVIGSMFLSNEQCNLWKTLNRLYCISDHGFILWASVCVAEEGDGSEICVTYESSEHYLIDLVPRCGISPQHDVNHSLLSHFQGGLRKGLEVIQKSRFGRVLNFL
ncbi:hypothetical protein P9112_005657 [Eukaryota sp. TZLM1-RC]